MTQEELVKRFRELQDQGFELVRAKNADYSNKGDALANFRNVEAYGISGDQGFLTRMSDKMMRISNLLTRAARVTTESIIDTLIDLSNYCLLLIIWLEQKAVELGDARNSPTTRGASDTLLKAHIGREIETAIEGSESPVHVAPLPADEAEG